MISLGVTVHLLLTVDIVKEYSNTLYPNLDQKSRRVDLKLEQNNGTIGSRLRQARVAKNLSIPDVSARTGISRGNLSTLETDKSKPSSEALIVLSKLYGVTTDWILMGEGVNSQFLLKENSGVSYDSDRFSNVPNKELMGFLNSIAEAWKEADEETRGWIIVQLRRAFPEIASRHMKNGM